MEDGILKSTLAAFAGGGADRNTFVESALREICRSFRGKHRLLLMPAGGFAIELGECLSASGFEIVAFLDNFKSERVSGVEAPIVAPSRIEEIDFDGAVIATPSFFGQEDMREQLMELRPDRKRDISTLFDHLMPMVHRFLQQTIQAINTTLAEDDGRKSICITTPYLHHNHLKLMTYLKANGYKVVVIASHDKLNGSLSIADFKNQGFYDFCHTTYFYDLLLPILLKEIDFDLLHAIVTTASPRPLANALAHKRCPAVVEYCDFKEILFDSDECFLQTMTREELVKEKQAFEQIYKLSDGMILKDSPEIIRHLTAKYAHPPPPWLEFSSYAALNYRPNHHDVRKYSEETGRMHVVYSGTLSNHPESHAYNHHKTLLTIARAMDAQGISFTIINAGDTCGEGYREYLKLAEALPLFHYRFAVPHNELAGELARYDLGWIGYDFSEAKECAFFLKTTFATKVFNYMEAGLPTLISQEIECQCRWIEEHGIGKGILVADIDSIDKTIGKLDFCAMRGNIARLLPSFSMEANIGRLLDFYDKILDTSRLRTS
jgi:hypothetical protein